MFHRIESLNKVLQEEVSKIIAKDIDFIDCIVTVTRVETSSDFSKSDVFITVMPTSKEKEALNSIYCDIREVQRKINKKLKIKHIPYLSFKIDEGTKNLYKIDQFSS